MFIAAILLIVNKLKLHPNKETDGWVELDHNWKVGIKEKQKQNKTSIFWLTFITAQFVW